MFTNRLVAVVLGAAAIVLWPIALHGAVGGDREGSVNQALSSVADGQKVLIDAAVVERVIEPYVFVRDPWAGNPAFGSAPNSQSGTTCAHQNSRSGSTLSRVAVILK